MMMSLNQQVFDVDKTQALKAGTDPASIYLEIKNKKLIFSNRLFSFSTFKYADDGKCI